MKDGARWEKQDACYSVSLSQRRSLLYFTVSGRTAIGEGEGEGDAEREGMEVEKECREGAMRERKEGNKQERRRGRKAKE